ncbi:ABC superfamily ATP binding cassette transporter [Centipeda periodontii DSM 2778]|uniref:ABC superfamily ATP binding cassette transporter n=1 Tax=Centipeda periodontii DSM 2778 TaxID=888060 RepID=F5RQM0_9FIRM|nr:AAA family ATPase [Centipeda periodontii]EGK56714.1 ABC superfamily ATP binding cassette transporter [Centipeda periodontii DSM 2778]
MKLVLKNFAKIKEAEIHFDGLTVIAGNNNTGKSTIGKVLFTLFHALRNMPQQVLEERKNVIRDFFSVLLRRDSERFQLLRMMEMEGMPKLFHGLDTNVKSVQSWYEHLLHNIEEELHIDLLEEEKQDLRFKIEDSLEPSDSEIEKSLVGNAFSRIFAGQINSVYDDVEAEISLYVQGKSKNVMFHRNECKAYRSEIELLEDAIYVDDPFLIDKCFQMRLAVLGIENNPLREGLLKYLETDERPGVIEGLEIKRKMAEIFSMFQRIVPGNLTRNRRRFVLETEGQDQPLNVENWSAGMKSFAILKRLLENGTLHEKGVLILDEPEVHLHPEWQLRYAEILVLLQKEFNLTVLITTHSPFFLDAIELYACKYGVAEKSHYYLSKNDGKRVSFIDVSGELDQIYEKMSAPVQILENLRAELRMRS